MALFADADYEKMLALASNPSFDVNRDRKTAQHYCTSHHITAIAILRGYYWSAAPTSTQRRTSPTRRRLRRCRSLRYTSRHKTRTLQQLLCAIEMGRRRERDRLSWMDAAALCERLRRRIGVGGRDYRCAAGRRRPPRGEGALAPQRRRGGGGGNTRQRHTVAGGRRVER